MWQVRFIEGLGHFRPGGWYSNRRVDGRFSIHHREIDIYAYFRSTVNSKTRLQTIQVTLIDQRTHPLYDPAFRTAILAAIGLKEPHA